MLFIFQLETKRFSKANKNRTIRRVNSLVESNTQMRGYSNKNILLTHSQPLMNHAHTVTRDKQLIKINKIKTNKTTTNSHQ